MTVPPLFKGCYTIPLPKGGKYAGKPYIRKEGSKWILPYPTADETVNHPIYQQLPHINIGDLLLHNHNHCSFLDAFTHVLPHQRKNEVDLQSLIACIVAFGSYLGLGKMSQISDISYHTLAGTANSFIRLETLRDANDRISNAIAALPIYKYWNINDMLHASDDGSKMETQIGSPFRNVRNTKRKQHNPLSALV